LVISCPNDVCTGVVGIAIIIWVFWIHCYLQVAMVYYAIPVVALLSNNDICSLDYFSFIESTEIIIPRCIVVLLVFYT